MIPNFLPVIAGYIQIGGETTILEGQSRPQKIRWLSDEFKT